MLQKPMRLLISKYTHIAFGQTQQHGKKRRGWVVRPCTYSSDFYLSKFLKQTIGIFEAQNFKLQGLQKVARTQFLGIF